MHFPFYIGTYTDAFHGEPRSEGIYRAVLDERGDLSDLKLVARVENPAFVAFGRGARQLYAVCHIEGPAVAAWHIEANGDLTFLNSQPAGGADACHLSIDSSGAHVLVANYGGGNVASFPILEGGALGERRSLIQHLGSGPNPARQEKAHAHSIYGDEANRFAYACDLGTDEVLIYRFDEARGTLSRAEVPAARVSAGGGPRHLALDPRGFAHVNNELDLSVSVFARDFDSGALTPLQNVSTLPPGSGREGVSTAEIALHPNLKWLYVSNRGHESIAVFEVGANGNLRPVGHFVTPAEPRSFALSPDGCFLVVGGQKAHQLAVFEIDETSGTLTPRGQGLEIGTPVCIAFAL